MPEICVVHLVGPAPLERFARSYRRREAGAEHRLLMVFKQFKEPEQLLSGLEYELLKIPRRKLDLATYVAIARQVESPAFYFLNSSELLAEGWLGKPWRHLQRASVAIVGAPGSYESLLPPSGALRFLRSAWFESHTFRSGGQRNLMVANNRTRHFAEADPAEQRRPAELAWGDRAEVGS